MAKRIFPRRFLYYASANTCVLVHRALLVSWSKIIVNGDYFKFHTRKKSAFSHFIGEHHTHTSRAYIFLKEDDPFHTFRQKTCDVFGTFGIRLYLFKKNYSGVCDGSARGKSFRNDCTVRYDDGFDIVFLCKVCSGRKCSGVTIRVKRSFSLPRG